MTEFSQTYWNDLIDKYRNGTISEQDRFQLEKQALDDPFFFDALEGFSLYEDAAESSKKPARFFTMTRIGIAASLVILVAVMFNLNSNLSPTLEEDESIAMVLDADGEDETEAEANLFVEDPEPNMDEEITKKTSSEPVSEISSKSKKDDAVASPSKKAGTEKTTIEPSQPIELLDDNSGIIAGAEVIQKDEATERNNKVEEMTSEVDDVVMDGVVVVKNGDTSVDAVNATNFNESRQENKNEMVPIGSAIRENEDTLGNLSKKKMSLKIYEAEPVIGKTFFDDFAKQKIDERGLRQEKPLDVTIEFKIDKNGNLTDFHHIYSGCPECGAFAIALLTNSGEWKTIPPGFSGRARYTFTF